MTKEDELINDDDYKNWKRDKSAKYLEALKAKTVDVNVTNILNEGAKIRVGRMTLKSSRNNMKKIRSEVYGEIHTFAAPGSKNRDVALKAVVKEAKKALDGNFQVRLQVLLMLSELELAPANPNKKPPLDATAFPETLSVFLEVIANLNQPEGVRVMAANCAEKVLADKILLKEGPLSTNNPAKERTEAARSLITAIKAQTATSASYQKALISAVGHISMPSIADAGGTQKPEVQTLLADIIKDSKRPTSVRAWTIKVLGTYPLGSGGSGLDTLGVSKASLKLAHEIGTEISAKKMTGSVGYFQVQDMFLGLNSLKNTLPADKSIGAAYTGVRDALKPMIVSLQGNLQPSMDATTLNNLQNAANNLK